MSLKDLNEHFTFGNNWKDFSKKIDETSVQMATASLEKYFISKEIKDKTFLDIGCGSGLFTVAALRLGFKKVVSVDIDPICVNVTKYNIGKFWDGNNWDSHVKSVFDLNKDEIGKFDVVYSWGVLHHTGAMYDAIDCAIKLLKSKGQMLIGLYQKTPLCSFWVIEKKIYSGSPIIVQKLIKSLFKVAYRCIDFVRGENHNNKVEDYNPRGMDYDNDLHDWLGGYPYESISPEKFKDYVKQFGLEIKKEDLCSEGIGLTGSGVNEYLISKKNKSF